MLKIYKWQFFLIIFLVSSVLQPAFTEIIITKGESVFTSNINLGCNHALNQARQKAQILAGSGKILSFQSKNKFLASKMFQIVEKNPDKKQLIEIHNRPYLINQIAKGNKFPISLFIHNK